MSENAKILLVDDEPAMLRYNPDVAGSGRLQGGDRVDRRRGAAAHR